MCTVHFSRSSARQIRKRRKDFKDKVKEISIKLSKDPYSLQAEKLQKPFKNVYSYHFSFAGSAYRMAFIVNKKEKRIFVVLVAPRENFYAKLRKIL